MNADVPEAGNLSPLDLRMAGSDIGGDMFHRLADGDEPEHNGVKAHRIVRKIFK
jgi:hypothetical protein